MKNELSDKIKINGSCFVLVEQKANNSHENRTNITRTSKCNFFNGFYIDIPCMCVETIFRHATKY
jgi:hypothetical protein